ncbi:MAG: GldG family protein [Lachnospiraceae bacterium]|nr:GldG family protein [Lachnospiraceae bacterium]
MEENNKQSFFDSFKTKAFKAGGFSLLLTGIVIAILIAVNFVIAQLPTTFTKYDISADDLYHISDETRQIVKGVNDDITVYIVASSGNENTVLCEFVNRYNAVNGKIKLESKDPTLNPNFIASYTEEKLTENSLIVVNKTNGRAKAIDYSALWYTDFSQMTQQEYYYYLQGYDIGHKVFAGEKELTSAIDYVTSKIVPAIYTTTDHGETELGSGYQSNLTVDNYKLGSVALKTEGIPADATVLLMNLPTLDITEEEKGLLSDFMAAGGKLLLISTYTSHNLENLYSLGAAYGLNFEDGMLAEGSVTHYTQSPFYLFPDVEKGSVANALTTEKPYIWMPYSHGLSVADPAPEGVTVTKLLSTSAAAYLKADWSKETTAQKAEGDKEGSFSVAAMGMNGNNGGVIWFTSPYIAEDSFIGYYSNSEFFMATLSTVCGKPASVAIAVREIAESNLIVSEGANRLWLIVLVILVPVAILVYGIYRWNKRRKR